MTMDGPVIKFAPLPVKMDGVVQAHDSEREDNDEQFTFSECIPVKFSM